jgi:hypothetical protein
MLHRRIFRSVFTVIVILAVAVSFWAQDQKPAQQQGELQTPPPVQFPDALPAGSMQAKATTACTECHEARIILQQRLSKAAWTKEVDKMIKWGALVDAGDHDALVDYLSTNFGVDQPPYQAPRTATIKKIPPK